jgi:hypothetical protein
MAFGKKQKLAQVGADGATAKFFWTSDYYSDTAFAALVGIKTAPDQTVDTDLPVAKLMLNGAVLKLYVNCVDSSDSNKKKRFRIFVGRDKLAACLTVTNGKEAIEDKIIKEPVLADDGSVTYKSWKITDIDFKRDASFNL